MMMSRDPRNGQHQARQMMSYRQTVPVKQETFANALEERLLNYNRALEI